MNSDDITSWLRRRKQVGAMQQILFGMLALLAGLVVLFLTFWFTYAVLWIGQQGVSAVTDLVAGQRFHLSHTARLICSGVFIVLLFVQHFRTPTEYWDEFEHREHPATPGYALAGGMVAGLGVMLAYPGASANAVAGILLIGPRLITGAWSLWRQGRRLKQLDENGCAALLAFLYSRHDAVPFAELSSAGWDDWLPQLRIIEGVRFLQKGLVLSPELRKELNEYSRKQHAPL